MRTAKTVGFAVDDADRPRLDHLTDVYGAGNRSAFLRKALDVMERYELAQRLAQTQSYGEERLASVGRTAEDIPELVAKALADPDPDALAQAKLIVAGLRGRFAVPPREGPLHPVAEIFSDLDTE